MIVKGRKGSFYSGERRKLGVCETQMFFFSLLLFLGIQAGAGQAWAHSCLASIAQVPMKSRLRTF